MATGATTGYAAGEQTNTSPVDYAQEITYDTPPGGTYQRLRMTGESLAVQDSTSAPDEITSVPEVAETILTGRSTSGSINGVLSYGTYDDFFAGILGADWSDLEFTTTSTLIITLNDNDSSYGGYATMWANDGKEAVLTFPKSMGPCLVTATDKTTGFTFTAPCMGSDQNGYALKFEKNALSPLMSAVGKNTLSPGSTITIQSLTNGAMGKTFTIRKKVAGQWQVYSGLMVNQVQIQLQKGQPPTVQIDFIGSDMTITSVDVSSAVNAATTSPLMDVVSGFLGCSIFGSKPAGCIQSATITLARDGSAQDTGMGHVGACGVQFGSFKASMDIEYFFKDYTEFLAWQSGQKGPVSVGIQGSDGYGYQFVIYNGRIFNPKNPISGKNATIVTTISVTGNPLPGGGTFGIARIMPPS
ncbi:phage tail protein [Acetobacter pomorum]|uniref:Phage tail protein n=1 Tax=Acetobacter pomorum TaxID=65959 RepID=A0A2G4RF66_9PROT|nr:phage tail tube protein [Acetobacter pomorum]PHY95187.1 phage tail protein [Acetobacter pomorum]GBR47008.1 hypothetical protein AA11825_0530 [Acetobacter pomorum DSM 11825]